MFEEVLFIDKREDDRLVKKIQKAAAERGYGTTVKVLPVGDYMWESMGIVIEHKTIPDFISSVRDGRLETQLLDMEQYPKPYLFVDGIFKTAYADPSARKWLRGWTVKHTVGSLCSILGRYNNIKGWQFETEPQFIDAIFTIKEKTDKGVKIEGILPARHSKTLNYIDPNFALYMTLPGIGDKKAKNYQKTYPIFDDFLAAHRDGSMKIKLSKATQSFLDMRLKPKLS